MSSSRWDATSTVAAVILACGLHSRQRWTATLDPRRAQVGNTAGAIDALQNRTADVNRDGRPDLVVTYSVAAARRVQSVSGPRSTLAFRYGARDGTAWLVSDISRLGSPYVSGG
ncbi:MAG TPA: hypothetical protein VEW47_08175 [Candidatus Dormibacteraeota bacterium]|nr:hypothetical protein [Candidatus Dormibacteraeota bacterium]